MIDCNKTLDYVKTLNRMCENCDNQCRDCAFYNLDVSIGCDMNNVTQKHIDIVQKWADSHPTKTRQSEFLKIFPNPTMQDGVLTIKPCHLDWETYGLCKSHNCDDCRKKYWLDEI